jgi:hypothetical protein
MTLKSAVDKMFKNSLERNHDTFYIAVDIHDTIASSTYNSSELEYWPEAISSLKFISSLSGFKIILFSSSYEESLNKVKEDLEKKGIKIFAINDNPDCANTSTGDFSKKFYYSLLIDDKAGFERDDWYLLKYLISLNIIDKIGIDKCLDVQMNLFNELLEHKKYNVFDKLILDTYSERVPLEISLGIATMSLSCKFCLKHRKSFINNLIGYIIHIDRDLSLLDGLY